MSQKALSDLTGISQGAIGDVESGRKKNLSGESLHKLCNHPRLCKYALWLLIDNPTQVTDIDADYRLNLPRALKTLSPDQQAQAAAFVQLLQDQLDPGQA